MKLSALTTEQRNPASMGLDTMSTEEMVRVINETDKEVAIAVEQELDAIAEAINQVYLALKNGGRLFYVGAGSSGRLGVMDASECPPTFMTDKALVQTIMAGGDDAFFDAIEGAEDDEHQGKKDVMAKNVMASDVVMGITASGRTPYPVGALKYARAVGAYTIALSSNKDASISRFADCPIEVITGPEILTGSTRMKAGSAHKMVLNMISTAVMVKLGKVYKNLMVDVHASNYKLMERAKRTVMEITKASYEKAEETLEKAQYKVKPAIIMIQANTTYEQAQTALNQHDGYVRDAIAALVKQSY